MNNNQLIDAAKNAMSNSYSPYSAFQVGAAALCSDDCVYVGCNIENASYGATMCAERTAIFAAVASGNHKVKKIAIVSSIDKFTFPCGMCRQVMSEFMDPDGIVVLSEGSQITEYKMQELLPYVFELKK